MKTLQDYRAEASLQTKIRYEEGILTKADWIGLKKSQGFTVRTVLKSKTHYNRTKFNRMSSDREQEIYMEKVNNKVECFELVSPERYFFDITKAEYNYFNSL
jgi:hypothetical protein